MFATGLRVSFLWLAFLGVPLPCCAQVPAWNTDVNGDPLPDGARARLGTLRLRHRSDGCCLAFAADGKTLATSHGNTVRLWQAPTGKELRAFETRHEVASLVFSPDGKRLATAGPGPAGFASITVWKTAGGKALAHFPLGNGNNYFLAFSPDGKTLAAFQRAGHIQTTLQLWDIASGKSRILARFDSHAWASGIAFAPDGKTLASPGSGKDAYIWDVKSGKRLKQFDRHDTVVTVAVFHPDGKHLATGSMDGTIRLWDLTTGKERRRWNGEGYITGIAFSANGTVVGSGRHHHELRVWTVKDVVFAASRDGKIALSPDGKSIAIAGADKSVHLSAIPSSAVTIRAKGPGTQLLGRREIETISSLIGLSQKINALAWSHDSKMIASAGGDGGAIVLWGARTGEAMARLKGQARALAFAPDRLQLALARKTGADLWEKEAPDTDRNRRIAEFQGEGNAVAFSPDGNTLALVAGTDPRRLHLFNSRTGKLLRSLPASEQHSRSFAFSKDGKRLALVHRAKDADGTRRGIILLDMDSDKPIRRWSTSDNTTACYLQFSAPDVLLGALTTRGQDGPEANVLRWWDTRSGRLIRQRPFPEERVGDIAFSPDGRMLALGGKDGTVRLWDAFAGGERRAFSGHQDPVNSLAFSPDGKMLASGSDDTTGLVWDVYVLSAKERSAPHSLDHCWRDLGSSNAADAFRSLRLLLEGKAAAVALLKRHLKPVRLETVQHLRALAANLDDDRFKVRDHAMTALVRHAEDGSADPDTLRDVLHACLKENPSLELSRRVDRLLQSLAPGELSPDRLRRVRALEVLERIASPEARQVLETLAQGARDAWLTREADAALERMRPVRVHP
jgi:WD40 repeat protein